MLDVNYSTMSKRLNALVATVWHNMLLVTVVNTHHFTQWSGHKCVFYRLVFSPDERVRSLLVEADNSHTTQSPTDETHLQLQHHHLKFFILPKYRVKSGFCCVFSFLLLSASGCVADELCFSISSPLVAIRRGNTDAATMKTAYWTSPPLKRNPARFTVLISFNETEEEKCAQMFVSLSTEGLSTALNVRKSICFSLK